MSDLWPEQIERAKDRLRTAEDEMHDAFGEWQRSVVHRDAMKREVDALESMAAKPEEGRMQKADRLMREAVIEAGYENSKATS